MASIVACFPMSRTAINKHLQILFNAGLVNRRRVGRETRYTANPQPLLAVKEWLVFFERYWDEKLHALIRYVEGEDETEL